MKILIAASEAVPFAKTGGLADVAGVLLNEYRGLGEDASLMLPLYPVIAENFGLSDTGARVSIAVGKEKFEGSILSFKSDIFFIECDAFFNRAELYGTPEGDYADNLKRFIFFDRAVLEACESLGLRPDIIHCNDWHTGLVPLYLKTLYKNDFFSKTATLMTIHNMGYQGLFDASDYSLLGLGREWFSPEGIEFYGRISLLKAGIVAADVITTVSNTYSKEILTPEFGFGLEGVLRKRADRLHGVINGLDTAQWNPEKDMYIPEHYSSGNISGKAICKRELLRECSLNADMADDPLVAFVGRLSEQKGIDILADAMDAIVASGAGVVILGKGDERFQSLAANLSERYQGAVFARIGFNESFGHRIYAGSDIFCMPSRYEPCGVGQLIAMRYGSVPVARKTGGLVDTITDIGAEGASGTGFLFEAGTASSLIGCLNRAFAAYRDGRRWRDIVVNAMENDFSWESSARRYLTLCAEAVKNKAGGN